MIQENLQSILNKIILFFISQAIIITCIYIYWFAINREIVCCDMDSQKMCCLAMGTKAALFSTHIR